MTGSVGEGYKVLVVLDPNFGERLRDLEIGCPVWIVESPANNAMIEERIVGWPDADHLTGITTLTHYGDRGAEGQFLAYLNDIDLHHGPMSATPPYTTLRIIGAPLSSTIRQALTELGFFEFTQSPDGFVAVRSLNEARRFRD